MLSLGLSRQPSRVGREKGKWGVRILAIFGKVEVHASDEVPRWVATLEEFLYVAFRLRQLGRESRIQFLPQRTQHLRSQVLAACHGRRDGDQTLEFLRRRCLEFLTWTFRALL